MLVWDMDMWPDCGCPAEDGDIAPQELAAKLGDEHVRQITMNDIELDERQLRFKLDS